MSNKKVITYRDAVRQAMTDEMIQDDKVFLMGEDVAVYGGAFGTSVGMIKQFGAQRVISTPISEAAISGSAVGAALTGMRPIVDIMFMDFLTIAMDSLINQAAKTRYMFGGVGQVPLTIRASGGAGTGAAAQHSQSLETWFTYIPGIKVVTPGTVNDVYHLLRAAIRDNNPVLFMEVKAQYGMKGEVDFDDVEASQLGKAKVLVEGEDVTIVTYGSMVVRCLDAAKELKEQGIHAEVVDVRCLKPLDLDTIIASIKKTSRVVLVNEGHKTSGFIGEISACISESDAIFYLDAPIKRVAAFDVPIPYSKELEFYVIPDVKRIKEAVREVVVDE